jgi:hypothetical protein
MGAKGIGRRRLIPYAVKVSSAIVRRYLAQAFIPGGADEWAPRPGRETSDSVDCSELQVARKAGWPKVLVAVVAFPRSLWR